MSINRPAVSIIAGAALVCCAALAVPAWRHWHQTPPPPPAALRLALLPVENLTLGAGPDHPFGLAVAPDGRRIAFPASSGGVARVWVRDVTTNESYALPGTDDGLLPFWSADGRQLGFFAGGRLKALNIATGKVADLTDAPAPRGAVWHPAGNIIFAPKNDAALFEWRADTGDVRPFTTLDADHGDTSHRFPALLKHPTREGAWDVVYLVQATDAARAGVWTTSGARLAASDTSALVVDNVLLYGRGDTLFAQQIEWDEDNNQPALVGRGQLVGTAAGRSPLGQLSASVGGDVIAYGAPQPALRELVWIDRGDQTRSTLASDMDAGEVRIAPGGGPVAVAAVDAQLGTRDIWVYEGGRLLPRRISQALDADEFPVWSPDASRIAWVQARRSIMIRGAKAQLPEQSLRKFDGPVRLWDWSPDGQTFVLGMSRPGTKDDLFVFPATGTGEPAAYAQGSFNEMQAALAPDGRWIAYASDESGQPEIYVDSFPAPGHRARVTTGGGSEPRWRGESEVFSRRGSEVHLVSLTFEGQTPQATTTTRLFDAGGDIRAYDVSEDGQRVLVNVAAPSVRPQPITVVVNWRSLLALPDTRRR